MEAFIIGVVGALCILALLGGGFAAGWLAHKKAYEYKAKTAGPQKGVESLTEDQRKAAEETQIAFETLMGYNSDIAYGLKDSEPRRGKEE